MIGTIALGVGISFIKIDYGNRTSFSGIVYEVKDNYFLYNSNGEKFYCYDKNHPYEIGDFLKIKGEKSKIDLVTLESDFDFNEYLNNKGVYSEITISSVHQTFKNPIRLKSFRNYFLNKFDEDTRISLGSILFSDHDDNSLTNAISSMHLSRLINAGGLYFNALIVVLTSLLSRKLKTKWSKLLALSISSFYLIITFPRFSIIRLTIMFIVRWINEYILKKKFTYLELISIVGVFFLLIDYHLAYQDSFILGFSIPIYLFTINNSFKNIGKWKSKIFSILSLYLFFIPFELSFYHSLSPLMMIYQLILSPLFIFFFFIGILCLYGLPIYKVGNVTNDILTRIINPVSKLNIEIYSSPMNDFIFLLYYAILFVLLYYASIGFKPFKKMFLVVYASGLCLYVLPIKNMVTAEVDFVNVGQGDCCFIRSKNTSIFIDTGGLSYKDLAEDCLIPYLKKKRVYNLDLVITTHNDFDHNGALSSLKENFRIKRIMDNHSFKPIQFGKLKLTNYNNHINNASDDNEASLVIGFNLGNKDYLICGDASIQNEKYMMEEYKYIPCDILKVGHHGSKTSSSEQFIKWLKPEIGVISCGRNNRYGHPHQEVISILKRNNVKIRRTDLEGTISFVYWGI